MFVGLFGLEAAILAEAETGDVDSSLGVHGHELFVVNLVFLLLG